MLKTTTMENKRTENQQKMKELGQKLEELVAKDDSNEVLHQLEQIVEKKKRLESAKQDVKDVE